MTDDVRGLPEPTTPDPGIEQREPAGLWLLPIALAVGAAFIAVLTTLRVLDG